MSNAAALLEATATTYKFICTATDNLGAESEQVTFSLEVEPNDPVTAGTFTNAIFNQMYDDSKVIDLSGACVSGDEDDVVMNLKVDTVLYDSLDPTVQAYILFDASEKKVTFTDATPL